MSLWKGIPIVVFDPETSVSSSQFERTRKHHYKNLSSINWPHEYARREEIKSNVSNHSPNWGSYWRLSSTWTVIIGTGAMIGVVTANIDYLYKWLTDLKGGVCENGFYMTYGNCCKGINEGDICEEWRQWDQVIGISGSTAGSFIYKYFLFIVTSLILATCSALLVKDTDFVKTSGISEVKTIISGVVIKDFLSLKTMMVKLIGLTLTVSSNLWAGKEGPLVHIACCCAEFVMHFFPVLDDNEATRRELLLAASASGISVAFNAPISGVIFTLEQLTSYFYTSTKMWTSFICAMTGTILLNSFKEGIDVYVTMDNQWLGFELFGFMILGISGGLFGAIFNKMNMKFAQFRKDHISSRGSHYEVVEVLVLSVVTSLVTYPLVFPRLPLNTLISRLYKDCDGVDENIMGGLCSEHPGYSIVLLICTGITACILTSYTFGTIVPAGVLTPALAIGAIFGRLLGITMESFQTSSPFLSDMCRESSNLCISPGAYAVVGSAAFLAGVTKMTVWVVVTVFELTGALTYVLPIMMTVIIARWTNDQFDEMNCYDTWIRFFHYPYLMEPNRPLPLTKAIEILKPLDEVKAIYLEDAMTLDFLNRLLSLEYQGLPILRSRTNPQLYGWVSLAELACELESLQLSPDYNGEARASFVPAHDDGVCLLTHLVERDYIILNPQLPLPSLVDVFFNMKPQFALFCQDGLFVGILTLKDISRVVQGAKVKRVML